MKDHAAPTKSELRQAGEQIVTLLSDRRAALLHCEAGIERTPMVACAVLLLMGWKLTDAYQRVLEAQPDAAPTEGQLETLRSLADELRHA